MTDRHVRRSIIEGVTLGLIATGAVSIAIAALSGAVSAGFEIFGSPVSIDLPVRDSPMTGLADAAEVASAQFTESTVAFDSLDAGTRWMLLGERALPAVATAFVCMSLWWLGFSLMRRRVFRRSMVPVLASAAIALIVAGMLAPVLGGIARAQVVGQLPASASHMFWSFRAQIDGAPIGWGIALTLIVAAFEVGQRLQRETEGLV